MARMEDAVLTCSLRNTINNMKKNDPVSSQRLISNQNKANEGKQNKRRARQARGLPRVPLAHGMGVGVSARVVRLCL